MTYECCPCGYVSQDSANFRRHLLSKTHIKNCTSKNTCGKCLKEFRSQSGATTHAKTCEAELVPRTKQISAETATNVAEIINVETQININGPIDAAALPGLVSSIKDVIKNKYTDNIDRRYLTAMSKNQMDIFDKKYIDKFDDCVDKLVKERQEEDRERDLENFCKQKNISVDQYLNRPLKHREVRSCINDAFLSGSLGELILYHEADVYNVPTRVLCKVVDNLHSGEIFINFLKKTKSFANGLIEINEENIEISIEAYKPKWFENYTRICKGVDGYNRRQTSTSATNFYGRN